MTESLNLALCPKSLDEVIGNASVINAIRGKLQSDTINRGWIFSGPTGTGKTTLADIVAREIQGDLLPGDDEYLDIKTINAADVNGVGGAREMVQDIYTKPMVGRFKVRILNEAQRLTEPAQEVFLDVLEKTDSSVVWIFTSMDDSKLIKALKRRCAWYVLKGLKPAEITTLVERASKFKGIEFDPSFPKAMDHYSVTSAGEVLNAFDKYLSGTPLNELVHDSSHEPLYADIARTLLSGNWTTLTQQLDSVKTPDIRALRAVVSAFLGGALLRNNVGPEADALSNCLLGLGQFNAFEDGVAKNLTWAVFYRCCVQIRKAKGA